MLYKYILNYLWLPFDFHSTEIIDYFKAFRTLIFTQNEAINFLFYLSNFFFIMKILGVLWAKKYYEFIPSNARNYSKNPVLPKVGKGFGKKQTKKKSLQALKNSNQLPSLVKKAVRKKGKKKFNRLFTKSLKNDEKTVVQIIENNLKEEDMTWENLDFDIQDFTIKGNTCKKSRDVVNELMIQIEDFLPINEKEWQNKRGLLRRRMTNYLQLWFSSEKKDTFDDPRTVFFGWRLKVTSSERSLNFESLLLQEESNSLAQDNLFDVDQSSNEKSISSELEEDWEFDTQDEIISTKIVLDFCTKWVNLSSDETYKLLWKGFVEKLCIKQPLITKLSEEIINKEILLFEKILNKNQMINSFNNFPGVYYNLCLFFYQNPLEIKDMPKLQFDRHHIFPYYQRNSINSNNIDYSFNFIRVNTMIHLTLHFVRFLEYRNPNDFKVINIAVSRLNKKENVSIENLSILSKFRKIARNSIKNIKDFFLFDNKNMVEYASTILDPVCKQTYEKEMVWSNIIYPIEDVVIPANSIKIHVSLVKQLIKITQNFLESNIGYGPPKNFKTLTLKNACRYMLRYISGEKYLNSPFWGWILKTWNVQMEIAKDTSKLNISRALYSKETLDMLDNGGWTWFNKHTKEKVEVKAGDYKYFNYFVENELLIPYMSDEELKNYSNLNAEQQWNMINNFSRLLKKPGSSYKGWRVTQNQKKVITQSATPEWRYWNSYSRITLDFLDNATYKWKNVVFRDLAEVTVKPGEYRLFHVFVKERLIEPLPDQEKDHLYSKASAVDTFVKNCSKNLNGTKDGFVYGWVAVKI